LLKQAGQGPDFDTEQLHDLGKLLFMSVMLWTYMSFSQYLITWSGQIGEEVTFYNYRMKGGWEWVGLLLLLFNFAVPFTLLLFRAVKRRMERVLYVCLLLLAMRWVDMLWLVSPMLHKGKIAISGMDFTAPIGLCALWMAAFFYYLERQLDTHAVVATSAPKEGPQDRQ
jgi:hypothetical protein